jgi:preprotein translocase subunit SecA
MSLFHIDKSWSQYLAEIADIREGIYLTRIGGQDPLFEFHKQSVKMFDELLKNFELKTIQSFNHIKNDSLDLSEAGLKAPSSTWTYLINDNPFENMLEIQLIGNIALSIGAGLWWPLIVLYPLLRKFGRKNKST